MLIKGLCFTRDLLVAGPSPGPGFSGRCLETLDVTPFVGKKLKQPAISPCCSRRSTCPQARSLRMCPRIARHPCCFRHPKAWSLRMSPSVARHPYCSRHPTYTQARSLRIRMSPSAVSDLQPLLRLAHLAQFVLKIPTSLSNPSTVSSSKFTNAS